MDMNRTSIARVGTPHGSERRSTRGIHSTDRRISAGDEELNERRIRNRTEKAAIGNAQLILKRLHKEHAEKTKDYKTQKEQWGTEKADVDAQEAQQRRKKKEIEEAEAEWKSMQQTVKVEKARLTTRYVHALQQRVSDNIISFVCSGLSKKELVAWEMDLGEEQRVLSEKEHEIAEFQKSHRVMINKLEQSIGRKASDWVHEIDEYAEIEQDDISLHESRQSDASLSKVSET